MILMEFKMGTGQRGALTGSGASRESKCRVCGVIPAAPCPRCCGDSFVLLAGSRAPSAFPAGIPPPAPPINPAVPCCCFASSKHRCAAFSVLVPLIVTAREEEPDGRNALSRIPHKHSLFLLPCALFGFHHKAATLRLFKGLRLIYCPFFSLCNALQEEPEATSDPCEDKMHRSGTCLVTDVACGHQITAALSQILSCPGTHFCEPGSSIPRFFRAPWRNLGMALGKWLLQHAQAARQLGLVTWLKTGRVLARFAAALLDMAPLA